MLNSVFIENKIKAFWNSPFTRWFTNQPVCSTYIFFIWGLAFLNSFHWNKLYPSVHLSWFRFLWLVFTGLTQRLSNKKKTLSCFYNLFLPSLEEAWKNNEFKAMTLLNGSTGSIMVTFLYFRISIYLEKFYIYSLQIWYYILAFLHAFW